MKAIKIALLQTVVVTGIASLSFIDHEFCLIDFSIFVSVVAACSYGQYKLFYKYIA